MTQCTPSTIKKDVKMSILDNNATINLKTSSKKDKQQKNQNNCSGEALQVLEFYF
jgi:hypothetical protein